MFDILPFPQITATDPREQVVQIRDYLFQFKEELEFILSNINEDNLSQGLVDKLNSLGADIEKNNDDSTEQLLQLSGKTVTVSDVINSSAFKLALKSEVGNNIPTFSINFETGQLEYK
jgi:hypothetical protein